MSLQDHPVGIALCSKDVEFVFGWRFSFRRPGQIYLKADLILDSLRSKARIAIVEIHLLACIVKAETGLIGYDQCRAAAGQSKFFTCSRSIQEARVLDFKLDGLISPD